MKVLLRIRGDVNRYPGGDYVQLLRTRETLEGLGFECLVSPGIEPMTEGVDIVHLFNTTRIHETWLQYQEARKRGVPVVLTPIWHSMEEMRRFYAAHYGIPIFPVWSYMALKEAYYARRSGLPVFAQATLRYRELQREMVRGVDMVVPNSRAELEIMCRELGVQPRAARVTPPIFDAPLPAGKGTKVRQDVVCAARIEPRKNQLSIIRAFKSLGETGHRLLLFGSMSGVHRGYEEAVRRELKDGWVEYRGEVAPEALAATYAEARGAILASYFETCGFSALEAMTCGAGVCISDTPYTREFYNGHAVFCNPFSIASIREGISAILAAPPLDHNVFLHAFSRETVLRDTREVYECLTN